MDAQCYYLVQQHSGLLAFFLLLLALWLIVAFAAILSCTSKKDESVDEQIKRIGMEAKEEIDRVSAKYVQEAYEQAEQGEE